MKLSTKDPCEAGGQGPLRVYREVVFGSKLMKLEEPDKGLPSNETRMYLREDPLAFMAFIEQNVTDQLLKLSWYQKDFRHRLFIFIGTVAAEHNLPLRTALPSPAFSRIFEFSKEYVPRIDPDSARFLNETFLPRLMDVLGISISTSRQGT